MRTGHYVCFAELCSFNLEIATDSKQKKKGRKTRLFSSRIFSQGALNCTDALTNNCFVAHKHILSQILKSLCIVLFHIYMFSLGLRYAKQDSLNMWYSLATQITHFQPFDLMTSLFIHLLFVFVFLFAVFSHRLGKKLSCRLISQDQDSLLVKRRNDNHSPGSGILYLMSIRG